MTDCAACGHPMNEHSGVGNCLHETQRFGPFPEDAWHCHCSGYRAPKLGEVGRRLPPPGTTEAEESPMLREIEQRYAPIDGKLRYLTLDEADLIAALRADPDNWEHIAVVDEGHRITVQHPVMERVKGTLFGCHALQTAIGESLPPGRHRLTADGVWIWAEERA